MTLVKRSQPHIYVANWFFMAFILATALLHIFNNLAVPVSFASLESYSLFSGVQDAMTQWWYGHNAVGFFLTAAFLGMMYYFVPKQAGRPIYSYRLSIVHFWALSFLYMWVGTHHLHWTAIPDWTSTLAATFSILLLLPSWGGMINGVMTLSGAWDKLRTDPIILFMITSLSFYGMSTFEGPLMSLKSVNALSHYTDWTVGHVHSGCAGLGGDDYLRFVLSPDSASLGRGQGDAQHQVDLRPLLAGDHWYRALHLFPVGGGYRPRLDAACLRRVRQPGLHLH